MTQAVAIGRARVAPLDPAVAELERARAAAVAEGRRQGLEEGRRAGRAAGLAQAQREARAAAAAELAGALAPLRQQEQQLAELAASLQQAAREFLAAAEEEMVALCYETICRCVGAAVMTPAGLRAQVATLLAAWPGPESPGVHVHPQDAARLQAVAGPIRWVPDPAVRLGGCIVRSAGGGLDARLEHVFEAIRHALLEARTP